MAEMNNWLDLGLSKDQEKLVQEGAALYKAIYIDTINSIFKIARAIEVLRTANYGTGMQGSYADALVQYGFTNRDGGPMNKALRSHLKALLDNEADVRAWWNAVEERKKRYWVSVKAIHSNWQGSKKPKTSPPRTTRPSQKPAEAETEAARSAAGPPSEAELRKRLAQADAEIRALKAQAQAESRRQPAEEQIDQSKEIEALREQLAEAGTENATLRRELALAQDSEVANAALRKQIKELERQLIAKYVPPLPRKLPERPNPRDPEVQMRHWRDKAGSLQRQLEFERKRAARTPSEEVADLQRQLQAAHTRIKNLNAEMKMAWQAAKENPGHITKADRNKLLKVFHPDAEARVTAERKKELTEGFQIFSPLNEYWKGREKERERRRTVPQ